MQDLTDELSSNVLHNDATELPLVLNAFGSKKIDNNSIRLFWEIPSEVYISHFEIEESSSNSEFKVIETVAYLENTNTYYSKIVALDANMKFYRLKLITNEGAFEYSDLIWVNRLEKEDITISPIASSYDYVNIKAPDTEQLDIKTFAINGSLLQSYQVEGHTSYKVEIPKIAGDTIIFEITKGNRTITKKVLRK